MPKQKLVALKPFPYRGVTVQVDEEFEPENEEQGKLLKTIGLAGNKKPPRFNNRVAQPTHRAVVQTAPPPASDPPPASTLPEV